MNKLRKIMDTPITWGSYLKFGLICSGIGMALAAAEIAVFYAASKKEAKEFDDRLQKACGKEETED